MAPLSCCSKRSFSKFHQPWQGPYEVEEKLGDVVYRIQKNGQAKQLTVHFNRLKPYIQPVMGHPTGETVEEEETRRKNRRACQQRGLSG